MKSLINASLLLIFTILVTASPNGNHNPQPYNPFFNFFKFPIPYYHNAAESYVPVPVDDLFKDDALVSYLSQPNDLPALNVLTESPYLIKNSFTVVPMLLVSQENMNFLTNAKIMGTSDRKPLMIVKTDHNNILQCTPAVKIELENPIIVYSLKTSIVFPAEIEIVYEGYRIPIKVGAVMAPISQDTFVSTETPVSISVVYAVPTKPVHVDFFSNAGGSTNSISGGSNGDDDVHHSGNDGNGQDDDHKDEHKKGDHDNGDDNDNDNETVVVDSSPLPLPSPLNVTVFNFPEVEGTPIIHVDEDDDGLDS